MCDLLVKVWPTTNVDALLQSVILKESSLALGAPFQKQMCIEHEGSFLQNDKPY